MFLPPMPHKMKVNRNQARTLGALCSIALLTLSASSTALFSKADASNSYLVQPGDSLYVIGVRLGTSWQSIASANAISPPYTIYPGEVLVIPSASQSYTVQSGDSLYAIGVKFGVSWQSIAVANNIIAPFNIYRGEILTIPSSASSSNDFVYDNFNVTPYSLQNGMTSPDGKWTRLMPGGSADNGSKIAGVTDNGVFIIRPSIQSASAQETHSVLVTSTQQWSNFNATFDMKTIRQLRVNDAPNNWEDGWVFFRFTDLTHYYYFHLKTTGGFELGKRQCDTCMTYQDILKAQLFNVNVNEPMVFKLNEWQHYSIQAIGNHITVSVDGQVLVDYFDDGTSVVPASAPLTPPMSGQLSHGSIAMYAEDAAVEYENCVVTPLP